MRLNSGHAEGFERVSSDYETRKVRFQNDFETTNSFLICSLLYATQFPL